MESGFHAILLIYKKSCPEARALALEASMWLEREGFAIWQAEGGSDFGVWGREFDLAVVFGGDGTLLGAARHLAGRRAPVFGVNFGRIGFLTASSPSNWRERLESALAGEADPVRCMALKWSLIRQGAIAAEGPAINDVVLCRSGVARLAAMRLSIEGEMAGLLRSDGLIVSTPIGSSGYNLSAGGPLMRADLDAMAITPICPFMGSGHPLVIPGPGRVEIRIESPSADCHLTADGQEGYSLEIEDIVSIKGWPGAWSLFLEGEGRFPARLAARGFSLERP